MALSPKQSGKFIAERAKHVKINNKGIEALANQLLQEINASSLTVNGFSQTSVHPTENDSWAADWIFVIDTLNFCFWSVENEVGWTVEQQTGYFALCTAINRAMRDGIDILNPKFYSTISEQQLLNILRSDNEVQIPLFKERLKCLHEVGNSLLENFEGSFINCIKQADNSAVKLLNIIAHNFKCFRDEATYEDIRVSIYKRAQILVGDIWACYKDYRVPQSLLYFNVLEYSNELKDKLKSNYIFANGDPMEVEIRGCSIHAVELVKLHVLSKIDKPDKVSHTLLTGRITSTELRQNIVKRPTIPSNSVCVDDSFAFPHSMRPVPTCNALPKKKTFLP
ncbi:putative Queuosine, Q, salvage protein family [Popillia japonica]|uniref:Queuosine 5'-phosphate N-glycosylase/hydrolase n=1 Tax=Popillia japonica TaxID=7064 RepID=A0AAW1IAU1_POPJA